MMLVNRLSRFGAVTLVVMAIVIGLFGFAAPASAQQGPTTYVVQAGDQLRFIAAQFGTTWQTLAAANSLPHPNRIFPGQVLIIPGVQVPVAQPAQQYVVRRGDNLYSVAAQFGTTWQTLALVNNLTNPYLIHAGNVLTIPATGGPTVQPPQQPPVSNRYTVQPGDTLARISARFGVDVWDLARANRIFNLNRIFVGQSLVIPRR